MTQEEAIKVINDHSVLIKEFSERLPHNLYFSHCGKVHKLKSVELDGENTLNNKYPIEICYPFLRPMSSMTEEEKLQLIHYAIIGDGHIAGVDFVDWVERKNIPSYIDWLNAHHFDYRGLIPKGLAIETLEGMYK